MSMLAKNRKKEVTDVDQGEKTRLYCGAIRANRKKGIFFL
jgi:hypothetical protein